MRPFGGQANGLRRGEQDALRAIIGRRCRPPLATRLLGGQNQLVANPADPITTKQQGVTDRADALGTGSRRRSALRTSAVGYVDPLPIRPRRHSELVCSPPWPLEGDHGQ